MMDQQPDIPFGALLLQLLDTLVQLDDRLLEDSLLGFQLRHPCTGLM